MSLSEAKTLLKTQLLEVDGAIRAGRLAEARELIGKVDLRDVARENRLPIASLFRRVGRPYDGLRLLFPIFSDRSGLHDKVEPTAEELCEYALTLTRVGGVEEAVTRLESYLASSVRLQKESREIKRALGLCSMAMWDYNKSEKMLGEYLLSSDPAAYETMVLRVNYAASLIFNSNFAEGRRQLQFLFANSQLLSARLLANCHELHAQLQIGLGDLDAAQAAILESFSKLSSAPTNDVLYLRKWQAYIESLKTGRSDRLKVVKSEAKKARDWETIRDTDRLLLTLGFDESRFRYLYFGTPHAAYRLYLRKNFSSDSVELLSFVRGRAKGARLDLASGVMNRKTLFKPGQTLHRMLAALFTDFYRPLSVAALHFRVFPGQYFNPNSSPLKVHQILHRLRKRLNEEHLPIRIEETEGQFMIAVDDGVEVEVPAELNLDSAELYRWQRLSVALQASGPQPVSELQKNLGWTLSQLHRTLRLAIDEKKIKKSRRGRVTYYGLPEVM